MHSFYSFRKYFWSLLVLGPIVGTGNTKISKPSFWPPGCHGLIGEKTERKLIGL